MSYCLNPNCQKPQNPNQTKFCLTCGTKLLLKERYFAIKTIGQGGFGKTFLGIDSDKPSKPPCVIKQFLPSSQGTNSLQKATELFNQEAVRLEELGKHSQIPELYAHFEQDNYLYLVQEYIKGETLEDLLKAGIFQENQIRDLLIHLLPVLQFIHDHHVIHRDIKPENIIQHLPEKTFVLVDFGAARHATGTALLKTGTIIGDPRYMSPEQLLGKAEITSDLYCLGVTCLYLLTGIDPLHLFDISEDRWVWRDYLQTKVSDELGNILDKMVLKATKRRFQSAKEIWKILNTSQPFSSVLNVPSVVYSSPIHQASPKILSSCKQDKKWGYIDETCTFVISPQYDKAEAFHNGLARVKIGNQWGIIDQSGKMLSPCEFDEIYCFCEKLHKVKKHDKWGIINEFGILVILMEFDEISDFHNNFAKIRKDKKWGIINETTQIVLYCEFDEIHRVGYQLAKMKRYGKWGMINNNAQIVLNCEFDEIQDFKNGLAKVKKQGKWGIINNKAQIVLNCEFDEIWDFSEGLAKVKRQGKWGMINESLEIVIPCEYDEVHGFSQGFAKIKKNNKYGLINEQAEIILKTEFDEIGDCYEDLIKIGIKVNGKEQRYGFSDKNGQIVIPCQFHEADNFSNGRARVKREYFIDKNGQWIQ